MKELVVFDVDNTIIEGQSQFLFLVFLYKNKHIGFFYYIKILVWFILYRLNLIKNPKSIMEYAFSFLKNRNIKDIDKITDTFFNNVLSKKIYPEAKKLIDHHKNEGRNIILISNAVDVLVKKIALFLDIQNFIATRLEIKDNLYTGKILGDIIYGDNKIEELNKFIVINDIPLINSWGYTDHHSDLSLLYKINHPNVINPTKILEKIAIKENWPILKFKL